MPRVSRVFAVFTPHYMLLRIHLLGENCFASTFCWRQMRRWFSGWFNVWHSCWKQNSFPGRATLESQQGDMKQSQACDALPQYRLPFHSHIPRFISGIYFPSPPLGGNSIWNFTSPLSLSLPLQFPLPMMDELHTLGCLSLSIMPCD